VTHYYPYITYAQRSSPTKDPRDIINEVIDTYRNTILSQYKLPESDKLSIGTSQSERILKNTKEETVKN
jgi:hypothetical protein